MSDTTITTTLPPRTEALRAALHAALPELRERYGVHDLWLFGSYVRGEQTPDSDLDVLIELGDQPIGLFKFVEIQNVLSDRLGINIDLVEKEGLKPAIGKRVLREAVPV